MDEHSCYVCGTKHPSIGLAIHCEDTHSLPHQLTPEQAAQQAAIDETYAAADEISRRLLAEQRARMDAARHND